MTDDSYMGNRHYQAERDSAGDEITHLRTELEAIAKLVEPSVDETVSHAVEVLVGEVRTLRAELEAIHKTLDEAALDGSWQSYNAMRDINERLKEQLNKAKADLNEIWEALDEQAPCHFETRTEAIVCAVEEYVEVCHAIPEDIAMCDSLLVAVNGLVRIYREAECDDEKLEAAQEERDGWKSNAEAMSSKFHGEQLLREQVEAKLQSVREWSMNSFKPSGPSNDVTRDIGFQTGYSVAQTDAQAVLNQQYDKAILHQAEVFNRNISEAEERGDEDEDQA